MAKEQNITFTMMANSRNEADAIAEAHRLLQHHHSGLGIEVSCGGRRIVTVLPGGVIATPKERK